MTVIKKLHIVELKSGLAHESLIRFRVQDEFGCSNGQDPQANALK